MKKILLSILFLLQNCLCFADCITPSEFVMQFLKESCSAEKINWETDLKDKELIESNYLSTSVKGPVDTVTANFKVAYSKEDDFVTIESHIQEAFVNKISADENYLKEKAKKNNGKQEELRDFYTEGTWERVVDIDEEDNIIRPIVNYNCATKMHYEKFIESMKPLVIHTY